MELIIAVNDTHSEIDITYGNIDNGKLYYTLYWNSRLRCFWLDPFWTTTLFSILVKQGKTLFQSLFNPLLHWLFLDHDIIFFF